MDSLCNTRLIEAENPYRELVGEAWDSLYPGVRIGLTPPVQATGSLRIVQAHSGIAGLIARMIKLPSSGDAVPAKISIRAEGAGVTWVREFGPLRAESLQTFGKGTYMEVAGPFSLVFRVEPRGSALAHVQVATKIFGIAVPRFFGPTVAGVMSEGPDARSWTVSVDIGHCWFGSICSYDGVMRAE